jgi:hypothetical protein
MSDQLEWRERLESAHKQMQEAMTELNNQKELSGSRAPIAVRRPAYARSDRRDGRQCRQIEFVECQWFSSRL